MDTHDSLSTEEDCMKHSLPVEVWYIPYDQLNLAKWKAGYPENTFGGTRPFPAWAEPPDTIGQIDFSKLIEKLTDELGECSMSGLFRLHVAEEQALQCVRLVAWLLANGRL